MTNDVSDHMLLCIRDSIRKGFEKNGIKLVGNMYLEVYNGANGIEVLLIEPEDYFIDDDEEDYDDKG